MHKPKEGTEPVDPDLERRIYGSWRRGKGLKKEGLMKKACDLSSKSSRVMLTVHTDLFPCCRRRYIPSYLVL